jgi:putative endonuclease
MEKQYYVYILTNIKNTVLYVGVTNNLIKRVWEHKNSFVEGFTKRYHVNRLVYYEICEDVTSAIGREKQIKAGSRADKVLLIDSMNRDWYDLYNTLG